MDVVVLGGEESVKSCLVVSFEDQLDQTVEVAWLPTLVPAPELVKESVLFGDNCRKKRSRLDVEKIDARSVDNVR